MFNRVPILPRYIGFRASMLSPLSSTASLMIAGSSAPGVDRSAVAMAPVTIGAAKEVPDQTPNVPSHQ